MSTIPALISVDPETRQLRRAGRPFFLLADTAWELFHRLDRAGADQYLVTRAAQGFNAVQAVVLAEFDGLRTPNAYGELPLIDADPDRPNEAYFSHVDWVVDRANRLGLIVALLPAWGDKWFEGLGTGPVVFQPENAGRYGHFIGRRYGVRDVIWVLGGDRRVTTPRHRAIVEAMARGMRRGEGDTPRPMTFHPNGDNSSADYFPDTGWLDLHWRQTGHCEGVYNWQALAVDAGREIAKPFMDAEPVYEHHPVMTKAWTAVGPWWDAYHSRRAAWWAAMCGVCGHTYGCHDVWQMLDTARQPPVNGAHLPWADALHLPGAMQAGILRSFVEDNGYFDRAMSDDVGLANDAPPDASPATAVRACRVASRSAVLAYLPTPAAVTVRNVAVRRATWFDPRTARRLPAEAGPGDAGLHFTPPATSIAPDWVLELQC